MANSIHNMYVLFGIAIYNNYHYVQTDVQTNRVYCASMEELILPSLL